MTRFFNLFNVDVSDARNTDEVKSAPKQSITVDYQHFMLAMNAWHSRCVKGNMKRIRVESMNRTGKEGCALEVGKTNFESEVLGSKQPVLVVFCAPWSKACRVLQPVLSKVMRASSGSVKFVKINSDDNPDLSLCYGIHSIPMLLYFVDGVVRARITGTASKEVILARLESVTRNDAPSTHS